MPPESRSVGKAQKRNRVYCVATRFGWQDTRNVRPHVDTSAWLGKL